jgi:hypothetical protein
MNRYCGNRPCGRRRQPHTQPQPATLYVAAALIRGHVTRVRLHEQWRCLSKRISHAEETVRPIVRAIADKRPWVLADDDGGGDGRGRYRALRQEPQIRRGRGQDQRGTETGAGNAEPATPRPPNHDLAGLWKAHRPTDACRCAACGSYSHDRRLRRFALSPRCVVWDMAEVEAWLVSRRSTPVTRA